MLRTRFNVEVNFQYTLAAVILNVNKEANKKILHFPRYFFLVRQREYGCIFIMSALLVILGKEDFAPCRYKAMVIFVVNTFCVLDIIFLLFLSFLESVIFFYSFNI
jgi:hypothetical protein